jgi:hypothetical protein
MEKAKIESVWLDSACCDEQGKGMAITVELDNGSYFCITLDSKADEPLFNDVLMGRCGDPQTDGERVYWPNGASLSIHDLMAILQSEEETDPAI